MLALGCMRLSDAAVEQDRAIRVIHAALDAGVTLLDTADVYAPSWDSVGHNERLVAQALRTYTGPVSGVTVATKGGLTRTAERWLPNGTAAHLRAAATASLERLGRVPLYQLHAPDPARKFSTSLKALAALQRDGVVERVGLCNVNHAQLEQALELLSVDCVQLALSPWNDTAVAGGVVALCQRHNIRVLAHTPLGGPAGVRKVNAHPVVTAIAAELTLTPVQVVLAWLEHLGVVPLVGCTRESTAQQLRPVTLPAELLQRLDDAFPSLVARKHAVAASGAAPRVVLLMGMPGAGKSTLSRGYVEQGYVRLSRDEQGGTLQDLNPLLDQTLRDPTSRVIMDNTYPTRASRQRVLQTAHAHGAAVECLHVDTSLEDAQVNAVWRMLELWGGLPDEARIKALSKEHAAAFLPGAQFRHRDGLETPTAEEGFSRVQRVPFVRRWPEDHTNRALILELDGVVRASRASHRTPMTAEDVVLLPHAQDLVRRFHAAGWLVLGTTWRPELPHAAHGATVDAATAQLLDGLLQDTVSCVHPAGPPRCWCRKPVPGMGVVLIRRHRLRPAQCVVVGKSPADKTWAARLGMRYVDVAQVEGLQPGHDAGVGQGD